MDVGAVFKQGYGPVIAQLTQTSRAIGAALRGASSQTRAQILTTFRGLDGRWQSQLSRLQTLKPPSNLGPDFSAVAGAGQRVESDLNAIVAAIETRQAAAGGRAIASIVADLGAAASANARLEQKLGG